MVANKIVTVIDGVPGVFIPLRDGRIETDNPQDGQVLMFDSDQGEFVNKNIGYDDVDNAPDIHVYRNLTGTAAVTTSPHYHCTRWDVTDSKVTAYRDSMVVCVKVPDNGLGNGSYGTALQINSLGYKPVVYNVNSMIGTRYSVGSVVWAVYNATQKAKLYLGEGRQNEEITGCWQVMDYNPDTTTVTTVRRYYSSCVKPTAVLLSNVIVFRKNETQVVPIHSVAAGTSGTKAYTANNGTNKTMTTEEFDPFGQILWYSNSKKIDANAIIDTATLYMQYGGLIDARRIFNCGQTLVGNKELYLVVDLQSDGMVKLATTPWSQTLPTTNDGHLYILLGITYDTYRFEFLMYHPIYYHDGTKLIMYTGAKLFSGDYNDLTNKPVNANFGTCVVHARVDNTSATINVPFSGYSLLGGGLVSIKFKNDVVPNAKLNINNKGAYQIWFRNGQITSGVIRAGDRCLFVFNSVSPGYYILVSNDRWGDDLEALATVAHTGSYNDLTDKPTIPTVPANVSAFNNDAGYLTPSSMPKEVFRCEIHAQIGDGGGNMDVIYADIQAAVTAGKTVICTLYTDLTGFPPVFLVGTTATILTGNCINNNVLYCFNATPDSGTWWNIEYEAIQTNSQLPSFSGNSGKVLSVNNNEDGVVWIPQSGGGTAPKETMRTSCSTAAETSVKDVEISGYSPEDGDIISVYFSNDVRVGASLRINSSANTMGIIAMGTSIWDGVIKAGDTATFSIKRTNPSRAYLLSIDRASVTPIPQELDDLSDVDVSTSAVTGGQTLIYDSSQQVWKNGYVKYLTYFVGYVLSLQNQGYEITTEASVQDIGNNMINGIPVRIMFRYKSDNQTCYLYPCGLASNVINFYGFVIVEGNSYLVRLYGSTASGQDTWKLYLHTVNFDQVFPTS